MEISLFLPAQVDLPEDLDRLRHDLELPASRLGEARFDQWTFPRAAVRLGAQVGFFPHASAPLMSVAPMVAVWDATDIPGGRRSFFDALALAALGGAAALVRPTDVPIGPDLPGQTRVPPLVPRGFAAAGRSDPVRSWPGSTDQYVLAICPPRAGLSLLLSAWTWVEGSLGDTCSLVVAGLEARQAAEVNQLASHFRVDDSVKTVAVTDADWPEAVARAGAVLHTGDSASAVVLRWAMAAGTPVAGIRNRLAEAIVGPAGYLVESGNSRGLGAACLTLLVEEAVAQQLSLAGRERVAPFLAPAAAVAWRDVILRLAPRG